MQSRILYLTHNYLLKNVRDYFFKYFLLLLWYIVEKAFFARGIRTSIAHITLEYILTKFSFLEYQIGWKLVTITKNIYESTKIATS